jgi:pyrroline-5-carboxylate reductase
MPYQLCILGCGTMGVAVLSGVLDNLSSPNPPAANNQDSAPSTPMGSMILDPKSPESLPDRSVGQERAGSRPSSDLLVCRFIATVKRVETVKKLKRTFRDLGGFGPSVQVRQAEDNVKSVAESDVILLWCVAQLFSAFNVPYE